MTDWYEEERFRGHVREPDVDDLSYIARDMKLARWHVVGRNWEGYSSRSRLSRLATLLADYPLRFCPSLCSAIYLLGYKGA
jgi:hypothetical protein